MTNVPLESTTPGASPTLDQPDGGFTGVHVFVVGS